MPRKRELPRQGVAKSIPVKLPSELAFRLQAFCEAHFNTAQNQVVCAAVAELIDRELARDEVTRGRFDAALARLMAESTGNQERFRLVSRERQLSQERER